MKLWWAETLSLTVVTAFTPLLDAAEKVVDSHAITTFGPLFPLYLCHVLGFWIAALYWAFAKRRLVKNRAVHDQLTLIAFGMIVTGAIALITNAALPYFHGNFAWCELGTLSIVFFLLSVAYATLVLQLFNLRVFVRRTLVLGLILTLFLGVYSSSTSLLTQYLTADSDRVTQFAILLVAFTFDPLRRLLEKKSDDWLFGILEDKAPKKKHHQHRRR